MKYNILFKVGVEKSFLTQGVVVPVKVNFNKTPHLLITAPSGSGKTYALKWYLSQLNGIVYLCDFKGVDFLSLQGCQHYFRHLDVAEGLKTVYNILQSRMANPQKQNIPIFLVLDEWGGFTASLPKKEQGDYQKMLSSVLMLGRGVNIFAIISLQRADSTFFINGARDNFGNAISLGRISRESARMLFPDDTNSIEPKPRGQGYLRIDGQKLTEIVIPKIRDINKTEQIIAKLLS